VPSALAERLATDVALLPGLRIHDDLLVQVSVAIDQAALHHPPSGALLKLIACLKLKHRLLPPGFLVLQVDELVGQALSVTWIS
jgi:hypothetical protein